MECVVCNSIALGIQVLFSLVVTLFLMAANLVVAFIDWFLGTVKKQKTPLD